MQREEGRSQTVAHRLRSGPVALNDIAAAAADAIGLPATIRGEAFGGMSAKSILAVQGAANEIIQSLLSARAREWAESGARVVGLVEATGARARGRWLRDLETGAEYQIDQDLGPGSLACRLTGAGIAEAFEAGSSAGATSSS